jgi:signal transduction histidine kinase
LREVCADAIKLLELSGVATGCRVSLVWGEAADAPYVEADGVKLQQVVSNLLENAIQHSPQGGEVVLQLVPPESQGPATAMAVIRICDCGSGIPADRIDRVFEPFYSTRKGGTGLGLALVRHFMEHMGGQVRIRNNNPPPGCTAEVWIPLAREEQT